MEKQFVKLPVICSRGVTIFPGQQTIMEVGRKESIEAIHEARVNHDNLALLVGQKDILIENPKKEDLYQTAVVINIRSFTKVGAIYRLRAEGIRRIKLDEFVIENGIQMGSGNVISAKYHGDNQEMVLVGKITKMFEQNEALVQFLPDEIVEFFAKGVSAEDLVYGIAQRLPFPYELKQSILEIADVNKQLLTMLLQLEVEKELLEIDNDITNVVKERLEANQKEYYLREKLRAIKEELGDVPEKGSDADAIRKQLKANPYPEKIVNKVLEELQRYEMLPQASGESGVIKTYIDWLVKLPWWQESEDIHDLNLAAKILDADHYGLEKIKERILEYLAVKQMTNSLKSPIICLVGPPGVGKTSLSKSIARALGRKFVKMSVGGVKDESEIRGHRRTYLGSLPGRIIQGMKKAGVVNPVFLIDEIDKMASDFKGDPTSAMLEVLDPEQNAIFSDHYLEEEYDLSKVMFIATANYLENIPAALRDRLEIINLSSYTELEKLNIAKSHLITKQLKENGLKKSQFKISDETILYLIRYYTREAGVRQLERNIAALVRKTVLAILKDGKKSVTVNKAQINKWLGSEKVDYGRKELKDQIGVVTGLAYTAFGGDILQIEATKFEGKGKVVITGQLGDVMKESASIALGYVKSNAAKYQIDPKVFETTDIHIHVPEGATPKDGPSAGITLTSALVSLFTDKKINKDVAMTGEVTLRGNVLPIGGLKEKSMAAHRSGIKTILIPKQNEKDIEEIPELVRNELNIISVSHVDEVLKNVIR